MNSVDDIKKILNKGVEEVIDSKHLEEALSSGKKLRVKLGIDPTSPNIHIGRAVVLWKLKAFQEMGHEIVFIVGDFTGLIGDTSDKDSERRMLTEEEIKTNMKDYFKQAFRILDSSKTETHYNSEWLSKLGFKEIARMSNLFGLHEFESREVIAKRLKAGKRVSLQELLYPLMQGYDSVAVRADIELGGTDQRFNLLAGRTIQPLYNQTPQDILMTKLLEGTDGRKMSSSWGNVINISDEPNDMFGKVMSISDDLIIKYFELATDVTAAEIENLSQELKNGTNPMEIKKRLAQEITTLYYGPKVAKDAGSEFEKVFSKKELPEDRPEIDSKGNILETLVSAGAVTSKSEAKKLIEQGAVTLNDKKIEKWDEVDKAGDELKVGPRKFYKLK